MNSSRFGGQRWTTAFVGGLLTMMTFSACSLPAELGDQYAFELEESFDEVIEMPFVSYQFFTDDCWSTEEIEEFLEVRNSVIADYRGKWAESEVTGAQAIKMMTEEQDGGKGSNWFSLNAELFLTYLQMRWQLMPETSWTPTDLDSKTKIYYPLSAEEQHENSHGVVSIWLLSEEDQNHFIYQLNWFNWELHRRYQLVEQELIAVGADRYSEQTKNLAASEAIKSLLKSTIDHENPVSKFISIHNEMFKRDMMSSQQGACEFTSEKK